MFDPQKTKQNKTKQNKTKKKKKQVGEKNDPCTKEAKTNLMKIIN